MSYEQRVTIGIEPTKALPLICGLVYRAEVWGDEAAVDLACHIGAVAMEYYRQCRLFIDAHDAEGGCLHG